MGIFSKENTAMRKSTFFCAKIVFLVGILLLVNSAIALAGAFTKASIEANFYYTLGLRDDGTVWAWGDDIYKDYALSHNPMQLEGLIM